MDSFGSYIELCCAHIGLKCMVVIAHSAAIGPYAIRTRLYYTSYRELRHLLYECAFHTNCTHDSDMFPALVVAFRHRAR